MGFIYFPFGGGRERFGEHGHRNPDNSVRCTSWNAFRCVQRLVLRIDVSFKLESLILAQNERWRRA